MFDGLRGRQPGAGVARILWWHLLHLLCYLWFLPCYRYQCWFVRRVPDHGPVLLVSNHQSFLDPIIVGLGTHHRQFYAMARSSLWRTRWLAPIIDSLNAVPVERGEADMAAMRVCITQLKAGHAMLIFPEGTRSQDGSTQPFAPGTMLMIRRSLPQVVPVAIEGAFDVWPRRRRLPRPFGRIGMMVGEPIDAQTLIAMGPAATEHLREKVEAMRQQIREMLHRPPA